MLRAIYKIAAELGCSRDTVGLWRRSFAAQGFCLGRKMLRGPAGCGTFPTSQHQAQFPDMKRDDWMLDNLNAHWSLAVRKSSLSCAKFRSIPNNCDGEQIVANS
jgi:hypothetical protein